MERASFNGSPQAKSPCAASWGCSMTISGSATEMSSPFSCAAATASRKQRSSFRFSGSLSIVSFSIE